MRAFLALLLLAAAAPSWAQRLPDLKHQDQWSEADKKAFIEYVESDKTAPIKGSVRQTENQQAVEAQEPLRLHKARYATLSLTSSMMLVDTAGKLTKQSTDFGGRLMVGQHLFSWVRAYAGVGYSPYSQAKLTGGDASLGHLTVPAGLELALIPLGTPHTRYVVLRGGASLHRIWGSGVADSDFATSLLGWSGSWDLGLGYEWQISNSPWRWHVVAEGQKAWSGKFYALGASASIVRTF